MKRDIGILLLGAALFTISSAAPNKMSCEEFSKNSTFSTSQAVGKWYLLDRRPPQNPGNVRCLQFFAIGDQESQDLQAKIGTYLKDVKWENIVLKMQIPCQRELNDKTRIYFLEKMNVNGSYQTLLMPLPNEKLDLSSFNRHVMHMKLIEGAYLSLMDCLEKFTFVMVKQPHDKEIEPALANILKPYFPEED